MTWITQFSVLLFVLVLRVEFSQCFIKPRPFLRENSVFISRFNGRSSKPQDKKSLSSLQIMNMWNVLPFASEVSKTLCYTLFGTLGTFHLQKCKIPHFNFEINMSPIQASAIMGLLTNHAVIYCASFSGMTSLEMIKTNKNMAILSAITAAMCAFFRQFRLFFGFGGRLGLIAFLSVCVLVKTLRRITFKAIYASIPKRLDVLPSTEVFLLSWLIVFISSMITRYLSEIRKNKKTLKMSTYRASGLVGLLSSFIKPYMGINIPELSFMGSFTGMMHVANAEHIVVNHLVATLFATILYYAFASLFVGFGGKLGAIAFLGVFINRVMLGSRLTT